MNSISLAYEEAINWYGSLFEAGRMKLLRQINFKILDEFVNDRPPLDILDGGGGAGDFAIHMATAGHRVTCVDVSPSMVELARKKLAAQPDSTSLSLSFQVANLQAMTDFADGSFDFILLEGGTLSYLSDPDSGLKEVRRMLRPSGKALITAQNKFHFMKLAPSVEVAAFMHRRSRVPGVFNDVQVVTRCYSPDDFVNAIEKQGLRVERLGSKLVATEILGFAAEDIQRGSEPACELAVVLEAELLWSPSFAGTGRSLMALCSRT